MSNAREEAVALHDNASAAFDRIRANGNLSEVGKQQQMAREFVGYRDRLAQVKTNDESTRAQRASDLIRAAFGTPRDPLAAMSYRDALSRAEQITDPRIAEAKLTLALDTGDDLMAQALASRAAESGWNKLLGAYATANPAAGRALTELEQLQARSNDMQARFIDAAHFSPIKPPELNSVNVDAAAMAE